MRLYNFLLIEQKRKIRVERYRSLRLVFVSMGAKSSKAFFKHADRLPRNRRKFSPVFAKEFTEQNLADNGDRGAAALIKVLSEKTDQGIAHFDTLLYLKDFKYDGPEYTELQNETGAAELWCIKLTIQQILSDFSKRTGISVYGQSPNVNLESTPLCYIGDYNIHDGYIVISIRR